MIMEKIIAFFEYWNALIVKYKEGNPKNTKIDPKAFIFSKWDKNAPIIGYINKIIISNFSPFFIIFVENSEV